MRQYVEQAKRTDPTASEKAEPSLVADRRRRIKMVNSRVSELDADRIQDGKRQVMESYLEATIPRQVSKIAQESTVDYSAFMTIGRWEMRKLEDFNSPSFYWGPYFTDLGRSLAAGEQSYLQEAITQQLGGGCATISRSSPDFLVLEECVKALSQQKYDPNVILAPVALTASFLGFFYDRMTWTAGSGQLMLGDAKLTIFWSHRYAPSDSLVVLNSNAGTWSIVPDETSGEAYTLLLGQSALYPDRVEIGLETIVKYEITDKEAFCVIELTD